VCPSPAKEDYLKAIYYLGGETRRVGTADLAGRLDISRPSVTAMSKRLCAEGLVGHSPRKGVQLTAEGLRATMRVLRRHRLLETFLVEVLGIDWSEVHAEAEVLEHHVSERVLEAMDRILGHPHCDPHGQMIPDSEDRLPQRRLTPLGALSAGEQGTVGEVRGGDAARLRRWKELGLVPGAAVRMVKRQDLEDVMHLEVAGRPLATGREGVEGVFIEIAQ